MTHTSFEREARELNQRFEMGPQGPLGPQMHPSMMQAGQLQRSPNFGQYMGQAGSVPRMQPYMGLNPDGQFGPYHTGTAGPSDYIGYRPGMGGGPSFNRGPIAPLRGNSPFYNWPPAYTRWPGRNVDMPLRPSARPYGRMQPGAYLPGASMMQPGYMQGPGGYPMRPMYSPAYPQPQYPAQFVPGMGLAYGVPTGLENYPALLQRLPIQVPYPLPGMPRPVIPNYTEYRFFRTPDGGVHSRYLRHPAVYLNNNGNWPAGPATEQFLPPYTMGQEQVPPHIQQAFLRQRQQFAFAAGGLQAEMRRYLAEAQGNPAMQVTLSTVLHMEQTLSALLALPAQMPVPQEVINQFQLIANGWTSLNRSINRAAPPVPPIMPIPPYRTEPAPAPVMQPPMAPPPVAEPAPEGPQIIETTSRVTFRGVRPVDFSVFMGSIRIDIPASQLPQGAAAFIDPRGIRIVATETPGVYFVTMRGPGPHRVVQAVPGTGGI